MFQTSETHELENLDPEKNILTEATVLSRNQKIWIFDGGVGGDEQFSHNGS